MALPVSIKNKLLAIGVLLALVIGAIGTEEKPGILAQGQTQAGSQPGTFARNGSSMQHSPWAKSHNDAAPKALPGGAPQLVPVN